jgi:hypothetical protein
VEDVNDNCFTLDLHLITYYIHIIYIVTCWVVTLQIISLFWILCSVYWIYTRPNLQLIITVTILLYSHCINSSPADLLYSCVLLIPIRYLVCVLLAASLIH